ncbi:MAG: hypothetical protein ACON5P_07795 [Candidatus Puniceispirillaceae bacterium]
MSNRIASNGYKSYFLRVWEISFESQGTDFTFEFAKVDGNNLRGKIVHLDKDIVDNGKDGDIIDINDVEFLYSRDETTGQFVVTFASLDQIHSAVIHNTE